MMTKQLIIFEGPDGGGKSTAIKLISAVGVLDTIHHGPYKRVTHGLARLYAESMVPAAMGHVRTLLDRSWLSEPIYGRVFRQGQDRLGEVHRRHLERLAWRCNAVVINCLPPWEVVLDSFRSRRGQEMLTSENQLREVYNGYKHLDQMTSLPVVRFDYTMCDIADLVSYLPLNSRHPVSINSAGNINAKVVLVGDEFGERKNDDGLYQWPFSSFSNAGCSAWLTRQLIQAGISEDQLCWVNANQLTEDFATDSILRGKTIIALGDNAAHRLLPMNQIGGYHVVPHPQFWKRFHTKKPYPLIELLRSLIPTETI